MSKIALIVFQEEKARGGSRLFTGWSGFLKTKIGTALYCILNKKKFKNGIREFEIEPGQGGLSIGMPFSVSFLSKLNRPYLEQRITKYCSDHACNSCYVPAAAKKQGFMANTTFDLQFVIFKALLVPILDVIYSESGIRLDHLDTAIVSSDNMDELAVVVGQVEPFMRYINIAAADKEAVEDKLSSICMDSGISIFVSSDVKGILRNADLIINMDKASTLSKYRIKSGSLVFCFSNEERQRFQGEYTVIRGVEYTFPENQYEVFDKETRQNFSKAELTEMLTVCRAGLPKEAYYNAVSAGAVLKVFRESQCRITGFQGRRGVLKVENILKTIRIG